MQANDPERAETLGRLSALGFSDADAVILADHFLAAERSGRATHGLVRVEWLEDWPGLDPAHGPFAPLRSRDTSAGTGTARSATSC